MTEQIRTDLEKAIGQRVGSVEPIPEGHSGFTYFVSAEDGDYVLRLPPPGARIAATADVMRQGRIMSALHEAGLPTPAVPFICSDPIVDGRPFILMERVAGERIEKLRDFPASSVEVLKRMQALSLDRTGIGDEESVPLQVEMMRWAMLMQRAPEELTTRAGELGGLLAAQVPVERMLRTRRGPKKARTQPKQSGAIDRHVATKKLLDRARGVGPPISGEEPLMPSEVKSQ